MNDTPEMPSKPPAGKRGEAAAEKAEAAAIRRRWITLGEFVAIAGLIISALALWNSWAERRDARAVRADEQTAAHEAAAAERRHIGLVAADDGGDVLSFKGVDCALQTSDIAFPSALHVPPQNTLLQHRIETAWFARPLLKLTDGGADHRRGRLPVLITSRCDGAGEPRIESAIYDLVWEIEPRLFGRVVKLRGMILREAANGGGAKRLDALWVPPGKH